jgi:hypothetical protein
VAAEPAGLAGRDRVFTATMRDPEDGSQRPDLLTGTAPREPASAGNHPDSPAAGRPRRDTHDLPSSREPPLRAAALANGCQILPHRGMAGDPARNKLGGNARERGSGTTPGGPVAAHQDVGATASPGRSDI